ncbi:MAG: EamA family transporter [Chloroflexi bacterium]|nr:EamA family transporter [Chloroflexota bacterium]MCL5074474.1 EamA family transporter [Chloroflexota bacterium]
MRAFLLLLVAICLSVSGELLLKYGVNQIGVLSMHPSLLLGGLTRAFTTVPILLGFGLVFSGSIFWLSVISRVDLSYAYPMLSLGYVLVVVTSWLILREQVSLLRFAGVSIICLGVFIVSRS